MTTISEHPSALAPVTFLELDLTRRCPLRCKQCFNNSGPQGTHGTMALEDWMRVIREARSAGVRTVQLIGGEPTLHPHFAALLAFALGMGMDVQVFSSLGAVKAAWWELFALAGVSLKASYFSDIAAEHDEITGVRGSHARTRAGIVEAVRRRIPIMVEVYRVLKSQRVAEARAELLELGVTAVHVDRTRAIGRASVDDELDRTELCGQCGDGRAAVLPDGSVAPCVMAHALTVGNVSEQPLREILGGESWERVVAAIPRGSRDACPPSDGGDCPPANSGPCPPSDGGDCPPAHTPACPPQLRNG